jgi:hypothetical protein
MPVKADGKRSGIDGFSSDSSDLSDDVLMVHGCDHAGNDSSNSSTLDGAAEEQIVTPPITSQEIQHLAKQQDKLQEMILTLHTKFSNNMALLKGLDNKFDVELLNLDGGEYQKVNNDSVIFL